LFVKKSLRASMHPAHGQIYCTLAHHFLRRRVKLTALAPPAVQPSADAIPAGPRRIEAPIQPAEATTAAHLNRSQLSAWMAKRMASVTSCWSRRTRELGDARARAAREEMVMMQKRMAVVLEGYLGKCRSDSESVAVKRYWSLVDVFHQ
jgi:hypothetical protein